MPIPTVSLSVLVVDDNRDAADSLADVLRLKGFTTRVAYGGTAALLLAREATPDVVLLDLLMPDLDGWAVAEELRRLDPAPVLVAVSGHDGPPIQSRSAAVGIPFHLVKPVDPHLVLTMLAWAAKTRLRIGHGRTLGNIAK